MLSMLGSGGCSRALFWCVEVGRGGVPLRKKQHHFIVPVERSKGVDAVTAHPLHVRFSQEIVLKVNMANRNLFLYLL